jgi:peptide/nickel transport system permease protein
VSAVALPAVTSARRRWTRRYGLPAFGAIVIVAWVFVAAFGQVVSPFDANVVDVAARLRPPSWQHWMGTDQLGRDVATRVVLGARVSLSVGFSVVLIGGLFGTLLGAAGRSFAAGRKKC